jgi:hypothetical protein
MRKIIAIVVGGLTGFVIAQAVFLLISSANAQTAFGSGQSTTTSTCYKQGSALVCDNRVESNTPTPFGSTRSKTVCIKQGSATKCTTEPR